MRVLVTGGCGFIGTKLVPSLIMNGYKVISVDTQFFGNYLGKNKNLVNLKMNMRDLNDKYFKIYNTKEQQEKYIEKYIQSAI